MIAALIIGATPFFAATPALCIRRLSSTAPNSAFNFTTEEKVYLTWADDDVPSGTPGEIVGFTSEKVIVTFPKGTWHFNPDELARELPQKFGFSIGEKAYLPWGDDDVPSGTPGEVIGFTSDKLIVAFPKGTWHFKPDQLLRKPPPAPKTADFGFSKGEKVYLTGASDGVPVGTPGEVVGFTDDNSSYAPVPWVIVTFPKGTWHFKPNHLVRERPSAAGAPEPPRATDSPTVTTTKTTEFGFTTGEKVYLPWGDDDVSVGTPGDVVGFTSDRVIVTFPEGTWHFEPQMLLREPPPASGPPAIDSSNPTSAKTTEFGFTIGEKVYLTWSDDDVPKGTSGEVVGFTGGKVIVTFPEGTWHFKPEELSRDDSRIICPSSAWACKCTTAKPVTELPLLKPGSVRTFAAGTQPTFYVNPVSLAAYEMRLQGSGVQIQCEQFFHPGGLDDVPCEVCENTDGQMEHNHPGRCFDGPAHRAAGAIPGMCLSKS